MQKENWLTFLSEKVRVQVSLENAKRLQTWGFGILAMFALTSAAASYLNAPGKSYLFLSQFLFVTVSHLILALGIYLPAHLERGEKVFARMLGIRDFTSLIFMSLVSGGFIYLVFHSALAAVQSGGEFRIEGILGVAVWTNILSAGLYLAGWTIFFFGLFFWPKFLTRFLEKSTARPIVWCGVHLGLFALAWMGYAKEVEAGSPTFFEQCRLAALLWIGLAAAAFWISSLLSESSIPGLKSLEIDAVAGKIERQEDLLYRLKKAFISRRLMGWLERLSKRLAGLSDQHMRHLQDALSVSGQAKPTEPQLAWMEDRYRKAKGLCGTLDRQHEKFLLALSFLNLLDVEREEVESLKDQFSKEARHAKLELTGVRKKIDEKLQALKESERSQVAAVIESRPETEKAALTR